jgi:Interferon-induced transmembrane protein
MSEYGTPPPPPPYGGMPPSGGPGQPPGGQAPPNYLVWAILSTVCCCLPLGIASIVYAAQVNSKWAAGDFAGAQVSSGKAKQFAILAAVIGLPLSLIFGFIRARAGS